MPGKGAGMRNEVIWAIRNAQGLSSFEKVFLYTVESHKDGMKKSWEKNAKDMGCSRDTYYRTRNSLLAKDLILSQRIQDGPTLYQVNLDSLTANNWESQVETDSLTENDYSLTAKKDSLTAEYKEELKIEHKEELKEGAEGSPQETKDSQTDDSLFVGIQEDAQIIKHDAESSSFVENKTKHFFVKVVGGPELSSKTITEAVAKYKADHEALGVWSEGSEESYPLALEKALDPNWKPGLFDLDRRVDRAFIEASHEKWREPEVVPVAVGDDW